MHIFGMGFNYWDVVLIAVVSAQSTLLAYVHRPKWKALLLNLPLPFTFATLSVGRPIDITNVAGFLLLLLYAHGVRILNWRFKTPIVLAIAISALGYCILGTALAEVLPKTDTIFWLFCALVITAAIFFHWKLPPRDEPGHRSGLPVGIKFVSIVFVIIGLIVIKNRLQGFMTMFPMVTLFACYEGRHCLWTICRQVPVIMLTMLSMVIVMRLAQPYIGYAWALLPGWSVFLMLLIPMIKRQRKSDCYHKHVSVYYLAKSNLIGRNKCRISRKVQ